MWPAGGARALTPEVGCARNRDARVAYRLHDPRSPAEATAMIQHDRKGIHLILWTTQGALAAIFFLLGLLKGLVSPEELQQTFHLVTSAPSVMLRPVGFIEIVGSLGLILPAA